jgi:hypothetical protein
MSSLPLREGAAVVEEISSLLKAYQERELVAPPGSGKCFFIDTTLH